MFLRSLGIRPRRWRRLLWRDIKKPRIVLIVIAVIVLYVEWFDTVLQPLFWPSKQCAVCFRALLVADPQIGGEQDEPSLLLRWDSDRYLSKWYATAYSHISPHAVIFLGDLMDEGSKATDEEFLRYTERFFNIFPVDQGVRYFYLPGDNDIGGEYGEPILPHVVKRFFHTFKNTTEVVLGPVHFVKVNVPLEAQPVKPIQSNKANITILLSHFPLISIGAFSRTPFSVRRFRPSFVISAHSHLSELRRFGRFESSFLNKLNLSLPLNIAPEDLTEISIPTCSYRMGVNKMGYGSLVIDPTHRELFYAVLWLPERFTQLYALAMCGFALVIYFFLVCCRVF